MQAVVKPTTKTNTNVNSKTIKRRGRPRRSSNKAKAAETKSKEDGKVLPCSRTRYGRLSRPPRGMKIFANVDNQTVELNATNLNVPLVATSDPQPQIPSESIEYRLTDVSDSKTEAPAQPEIKRQRNIERFKCLTCKKVCKLHSHIFISRKF